jgi:GxxExxY protein
MAVARFIEQFKKHMTAVVSELGSCQRESVYVMALAYDLMNEGWACTTEKRCEITYRGIEVGVGYADLYALNARLKMEVIVEMKATGDKFITAHYKGQCDKYSPLMTSPPDYTKLFIVCNVKKPFYSTESVIQLTYRTADQDTWSKQDTVRFKAICEPPPNIESADDYK